ncbi:MAG: hypothetical protein GX605_13820, partial [Chloroflexi bacterium]|nr:hypothetical protein [Chloroflexota bacterium]
MTTQTRAAHGRFSQRPTPQRALAVMALAIVLTIPGWVWGTTVQADVAAQRPTPTPAVMILLTPSEGMPNTAVLVQGYGFASGRRVTIHWDGDTILAQGAPVNADGSFAAQFTVPVDERGHHVVRAADDGQPETAAEAVFRLIIPTPTPTDTPT